MAWERSGVPGGSTTRTSWFDRDLPAMWRVLENQQSDDHWRLVAGWRKASELTATHLRRLEHYRTNLADVWPPDRNAAAAAYVARLDFLIQNVRTTHEVAAANYSTLAATVGALAAARRDLKPLHDEYMAKARAIKEHADLAAFNAAAEAPTVIGAAPAAAQDLERLNNRARAIMYTLSHTLVEAEAAIRQPPTYEPRDSSSPVDPDVYGGHTPAVGNSASPREPLSPRLVENVDGDRFGTAPESASDGPRHGSTPAAGRDGSDRLPSLGSATTPAAEAVRPSTRFGRAAKDVGANPNGPRVLPVGGIIGPTPPTSKSPSPREGVRVNPIGGVISGQHLVGVVGASPPASLPAFGAFGLNSKDQQRATVARQGDSETNWILPEGVPPVIVPQNAPRDIDPGPVIGLKR